jgi:hypothetical protein
MAEAAALALAATVTAHIQIQRINFLSDNQELVNFFNSSDLSHPPDWRIKHMTQHFINYNHSRSLRTYKISGVLNQTADTLARQALRDIDSSTHAASYSCSNADNVNQCTLQAALQSVTIDFVMVLAAACC